MSNTRKALARRLATFAFISIVLLFSVAPVSQSIYGHQAFEPGKVNDHGDLGSLTSPIVAQRVPPVEEKVLVLRAWLVGALFDVNINTMKSMFTNDVKNYYQEVSYNQVFMNTTFINKNYTMSQTEDYYGQGTDTEPHVIDLVTSTITAAEADVNASGGYKAFRHIIIVHSGSDQAATRNPDDITSQFIYKLGAELFTLHGVKIWNASMVSENDPLGVVVHELGHSEGLPDLYSYATSGTGDTFLGEWDLMATGSWNPGQQGTSPSHPTTWGKNRLGWIKSTQIFNITQVWIAGGHNATVLLNPQEFQNKTLVIRILLSNGTYYQVESRLKTGYDGALPANGVLILFVDDSKQSGQGPVRLISAHPPSLGSDAVFNVGWFMQPFYGDSHSNIGFKVLNKWSNGTFKIFVGSYNAALNIPTEYQDTLNIPLVVLVGGAAVFVILAAIIYLKKGRQKTGRAGYDSVPVIKLS